MNTTTQRRSDRDEIPTQDHAPGEDAPRDAGDRNFLLRLAIGLLGAAAAFYLLRALGDFLRPVLIALLLCYAIWPIHERLKRHMRPGLSLLIIFVGLAGAFLALGWAVFGNADQFWKDMPKYQERAGHFWAYAKSLIGRYVPFLASRTPSEPPSIPIERFGEYLRGVFGAFAGFVAQAGLVVLYVLFMLIEASRFPRAIRRAFSPERAHRILEVVGSINEAVIEYLSVKVRVNLIVAVPATLLMMVFRVEGAILWGVVTFFARFIPYLGGIVAYVFPVASAALLFESPWRTAFFAAALLVIHVVGEYFIEPVMTGKAVGLSPLVVLLALAFWDLTWGVVGMILAVPLTVMLKIALERLDITRPVARVLAEND
jgi:AI-2 transport protein TqsA